MASDAAVPRPRTILYYSVASKCGTQESLIGHDSTGAPAPRAPPWAGLRGPTPAGTVWRTYPIAIPDR